MLIKKDLLITAILTLVTVVALVIFNINHSQSQVEISSEIQNMLSPIDPNFNTKVFDDTP